MMFSFLIGLIGSIIALVGWFSSKSIILLFVGTGLYIVETIMEWKSLNSNAKILDAVIFVIGCIISVALTASPWYVGGMIAIAIYSFIMGILGVISVVRFFI